MGSHDEPEDPDALSRASLAPDGGRSLIETAVAAVGRRKVQEGLIGLLENGTNAEKAGVPGAWYWTLPALVYRLGDVMAGGSPTPTEESKREYDAVADLRARWNQAALREFVANEDLNVRRSLLSQLSLDPAGYPDDLRDLVATALCIARTHPDEYIRRQVEDQD